MFGEKTCNRCILPGNYPNITFDEEGICNFCNDYELGRGIYDPENIPRTSELRKVFESSVNQVKEEKGNFDCIVPLSGGKDSAYLAKLALDEYGMKTLLFSIDTGFHPRVAHKNMVRTVDKLRRDYGERVEHIFTGNDEYYRGLEESFIKIYRHGFENPGEGGYVKTICYTCGPLLIDLAMDLAAREDIPLVLEGYSPGQPDPEFMFFEFEKERIKSHHLPEWMTEENRFSEGDRKWFWNPERYPEGTEFPRVIAPFHALDYNEGRIIKEVVRSGLIQNQLNANPIATNCDLNWPMVYLDNKKSGYNPYVWEFAESIRKGERERWKWGPIFRLVTWAIMNGLFKDREIKYISDKLGLNLKQLE
jgi:hypothetical protein